MHFNMFFCYRFSQTNPGCKHLATAALCNQHEHVITVKEKTTSFLNTKILTKLSLMQVVYCTSNLF